ncbi:MAG: protein translocase subunit SecF [Bacillota bacterium]|jgi:preprotein translocase subunit SecF
MMLDIIGKRKLIVLIAAAIVAIGIISLAVQGLNFGIDFTGGTRLMLSLPGGFTTAEVRDVLATVEATDASGRKVTLENSYIQEVIGEEGNEVVIRTVPLSEEELETVLAAIKANWPDFSEEDIRNVENVGPVVGGELLRNALLALGLASIAMIIYVSIRFQFNFAVAALLPLLFNSFVVVAVFSLFQIEINSPFVAVILTIVGYSINDTIVIFDRIRENIKYNPSEKQLAETVNTSVRQSFVRCLNTSVTTLLVVGSLLFIGGETITPFALPLFIGIICGTISSLFLASPLWYILTMRGKSLPA